MGNVLQGGSGLSPDIDDNIIKIFTTDLVPKRQFADTAKPVYTQFFPILMGGNHTHFQTTPF
jgi:hypothetical protein